MNISALFGHMDMLPFVYGFFIFVNIILLGWKLKTGRIFSFAVDIGVFWMVFSMHSGSMTGALAALIAATLVSAVLPMLFSKKRATA
jgi:hypothetical protein